MSRTPMPTACYPSRMKALVSGIILALALALSGCGSSSDSDEGASDGATDKKPKVWDQSDIVERLGLKLTDDFPGIEDEYEFTEGSTKCYVNVILTDASTVETYGDDSIANADGTAGVVLSGSTEEMATCTAAAEKLVAKLK